MAFIIYSQQDNKLAVIMPTGDVNDAIKDVPEGKPYAVVSDLSNVDYAYFDGFVYEDGEAVADIASCKTIHKNKWRAARKPLLEKLDVEYMRALEIEDTVSAASIAVQKQELRDVTQTELPDTLSEIKEVWPECLGQKP